jgi:hypothetical protein
VPPTSVDVTKYILGAAEIYYRATGVLTAWTSVGLTMGDAIARISQTMQNPSESLNHIDGPIRGLDYRKGGPAVFEFDLPELSAANLALAIPGAVEVASATTDAGGTPLSTTLAADAAIGATNIKVTGVTNAAVGDFVRINVAGALAEYRQLTSVGTAGAGGTGLGFRDPLLKAHLSGVAVVETIGDGRSSITASSVRRQPLTAYKDWAIVTQSLGGYYEIRVYRAMAMTESIELSFDDDASEPAGIHVTLEGRKDETNLALPAWEIFPAAA